MKKVDLLYCATTRTGALERFNYMQPLKTFMPFELTDLSGKQPSNLRMLLVRLQNT